jgi:hypothetical protein
MPFVCSLKFLMSVALGRFIFVDDGNKLERGLHAGPLLV